MEYNVELKDGMDVYQENSLTLILKQLKPNSSVLEFGPAYGRMTRYMKEQLKCQVSCIEINPKAKESLEKYAKKVYIGNIEEYTWLDEFKGEAFDYIIFADVLEHMVNPKRVLEKAIEFLDINGQVFISVPNIAHNAIIESLYLNQFEYQDSGILDRTHLHFFTKNSLEELIASVGLSVFSCNATYYSREMTGIIKPGTSICPEMQVLLNQRKYADIYQLVYGAQLKAHSEKALANNIDKRDQKYTFKVYWDHGEGFSENSVYKKKFSIESENIFEIPVQDDRLIERVRIDPIDINCMCSVQKIVLKYKNGEEYFVACKDITCGNALQDDNTFIFVDDDPQIILEGIKNGLLSLTVKVSLFNIGLVNTSLYKMMEKLLNNLRLSLDLGKKTTENIQRICDERGEKIAELSSLLSLLKNESNERAVKIAQLEDDVLYKKTELGEMRDKIKDMQVVCDERGEKVAELTSLISLLNKESSERGIKIAQLEEDVFSMKMKIFEKNRELIKNSDNELKKNQIFN